MTSDPVGSGHERPGRWAEVDAYLEAHAVEEDEALRAARADSEAADLPPISVTAAQGKFLALIARLIGARTILEIGTLGGYSTIWLARALAPGGRLITLEFNPHHANVARANLARAGLAEAVEVREGAALDLLPVLADEGVGPFDLVFVDADKVNNAAYLSWAHRLTRPGSVIIVDNVVRQGAVVESASTDPNVVGTREMFVALHADQGLDATALQTVGAKGHDGFVLALVTAPA